MKQINVGLNGFGRIGRAFTRIALNRQDFNIALINTRRTSNGMLAYLLEYDSVYRRFNKRVKPSKNGIIVGDTEIAASQSDNPSQIPWEKYNVSIVVDATGAFRTTEALSEHLGKTVKKVVLTSPAKDEKTSHCVIGVNEKQASLDTVSVVSNASCTTNSAAVLFKVLHDSFGVKRGFLTTAHAYTGTQSLVDDANKTKTRSRAATLSIVPTTTGAAKTVARVIPELKGKIDGLALRVPVPVGSFTDITAELEKPVEIQEINTAFKSAAGGYLKGVLAYEEEALVSSDYIGSPYSCIYDANYTNVVGGTFVKVTGWYDNEWGYSHRLVDLVSRLANYIS